MDLEKQVRELADREEIKELRYRYCTCVDDGNWNEFLNLFTEDAKIRHNPTDSTYTGEEELSAFATHLEEDHYFTVHMLHNPILEIDDNEATGQWDFEVVEMLANETVEWLQGRYDEIYRRADNGWRFEMIDIDFNYRADFYDMDQVRPMVR